MLNLNTGFIPFIRTKFEQKCLHSTISDINIVRITADYNYDMADAWQLWIDPGFDSFENIYGKVNSNWNWRSWITKFKGHEMFMTEDSAISASQVKITDFVNRILNRIITMNPTIISVPQLAYTSNKKRHSFNKKLARAAGKWKDKYWSHGILALPVILTHQETYRTKAESYPRIKAICRSREESNSSIVWVVHANLDDLAGISTYQNTQFPKLIDFHQKLYDELPAKTITCAGPYWALNLILWARNIINIPAVGCGGMFRYTIPGPFYRKSGKPISRIALPPLRRWYIADSELLTWIKAAKTKFKNTCEEYKNFQKIESNFSKFSSNRNSSIIQSAEFYYNWIKQIASVQKGGRGLFMFQDFSRAVVNGSLINKKLPRVSGLSSDARNPGYIAQQLMLQCLPR